ncbi:hypothetical protein [Falsiroseomonas sp. E2-1-a20]|uniref:hypothetical protein n=1 Tax=Falsiroseomonas sp. E2-1-a20 TaxID=3239300 RepID=UPI003F371891
MFELDVHTVEILKFFCDIENVSIAELLHALMRTAQQILIEIEDLDLHIDLKLLLQGPGIARYSAQFVVGADDCEARALRHDMTRRTGFGFDFHSLEVPVYI